MLRNELLLTFITLSGILHSVKSLEYSEESLVIKPLNNHQAYFLFNFSTVLEELDQFSSHHYNLFPRSVGEIVQKYNIVEFHLTMTQGLWKYETWGTPYFSSPPGAQLWVWFHPNTKDVDQSWYGFTNALSGLLCASLNFISKKETVTPTLSFKPEGYVSNDSQSLSRYAILSRESICTENLTPWLKLLPCGSDAGISWLLNPARLHHSQFLSIGLNFKTTCSESNECRNTGLNLYQSVSSVFDIRSSTNQKPDFSLRGLLQRRVKGSCPMSRLSQIKVQSSTDVSIDPPPNRIEDDFFVYDLKEQELSNIELRWNRNPPFAPPQIQPLIVYCHLTGYGQHDGGIQCHLQNSLEKNITVIIMQNVPWFLTVYLHTLKITDQAQNKLEKSRFNFHPAKIRESPHVMEYILTVPHLSTAIISLEFTRGFLTWTEHPPDANHGFYIPSTVVTVPAQDLNLITHDNCVHRIYSEALQVHIPVPDFSMPYNVICLVCTVIAIAFGSLHNLTARRLQKVDPDDNSRNIFTKILNLLKMLFDKIQRR